MAGYRGGVPPKNEEDRVNKIPKKFEKTIIQSDEAPTLRGPDLPDTAPGDVVWCERTLEWWLVWRSAPQAKLLTPTDWETMFEAAILHNELWRPRSRPLGTTAVANFLAELRRRVGAFGATWEDRQKLQLAIQSPQADDETEARIAREAKAAVDYASRLAAAAAKQKKSG